MALGERVEKHVGTSYTEFIFNPQQIQADASDRSTSCCAWEYLFFGARRFGKYASNETYFSHADKIHTMGTVTDYTGAVVQDAIYHPWGQEWAMAGTMMDERFASLNQRDSESSLDPTHFRMMSSYVGRWMSPDPAKACVLHPQERNRYAYVINGPTNLTDPTGDQFGDDGGDQPGGGFGNFGLNLCGDAPYAMEHPDVCTPQTTAEADIFVAFAELAAIRDAVAHIVHFTTLTCKCTGHGALPLNSQGNINFLGSCLLGCGCTDTEGNKSIGPLNASLKLLIAACGAITSCNLTATVTARSVEINIPLLPQVTLGFVTKVSNCVPY